MEAIYEATESFTVPWTPAEALQILTDHLKSNGCKPQSEQNRVTVHTGSNFFLRIWGTVLPWGRRSVPVGMTVSLEGAAMGSVVKVHTYDRLGWYLDASTNLTLKEECHRKMAVLSELACKALNQQA